MQAADAGTDGDLVGKTFARVIGLVVYSYRIVWF